ncbi:hypothetical protein BD626DRAFT_4671 [Schizophyllum amplum]|uniref:Xylanolytic transcriptional activator regulatory domain-containing protein n=1 Tax=Schizophyllum amplum TaxID=97359 RepID=A0A550CW89_9AGAR|nr:hypothetical protein BD626DRAFT_4671 [Auriculariopsis ampla]
MQPIPTAVLRKIVLMSVSRRGYEHLCPDGTGAPKLSTSSRALKETVFELEREGEALEARVKQLEDALQEAEGKKAASKSNRTLGRRDEMGYLCDAVHSMRIGDEVSHHAQSSQKEEQRPVTADNAASDVISDKTLWSLPQEIVHLSNTFPVAKARMTCSLELLVNFLPEEQEARRFARNYYSTAPSIYNSIPESIFMAKVFGPIYDCDYSQQDFTRPASTICPASSAHRLSVLFTICAIAAMQDEFDPQHRHKSHFYQTLGRAAFAALPVSSGASALTIDALLLQTQLPFSMFDQTVWNECGILLGVCRQLITASGMHRDLRHFSQDEIEERRRAFWQYYFVESAHCLEHGNFPSFANGNLETPFPPDYEPVTLPSGHVELSFDAWKVRFTHACISPGLRLCTSGRPPNYDILVRMTELIHAFEVPLHLRCTAGPGEGLCYFSRPPPFRYSDNPKVALQQFFVVKGQHILLTMIHRRRFMQAVDRAQNNGEDVDPVKHEYAMSAITVFNSAVMLLQSMKTLHAAHEEVLRRYWRLCSSLYFAGIVALTRIVIEQPMCFLAQEAVRWLEGMVPFFQARARESDDSDSRSVSDILGQGLHRARYRMLQRHQK